MERKTYSGEEFLQALSTGELRPRLCRLGFVKPVEDASGVILFSEDPARLGYVRIPVDMITTVEHITTFPSGDQDHFYVCVCFKQPTDNAAAKLFADLLRHTSIQSQPLPPGFAVAASRPPAPVFINPQPFPPG